MSSTDWVPTTLGECATFISGGTPSKSEPRYWAGDIPWVSAKDMKLFRLHDAEDHVTSEGVDSGSALAPLGSTLLLVRGMTLHERVPVCLITRPMAFNQDVKALVAKQGVDQGFLAYWLAANEDTLLNRVDSASHGTGRLLAEALRSLPVTLPPLPEQRKIVNLLASLDDKIELNRSVNEILGTAVRVVFQEWFPTVLSPTTQTANHSFSRIASVSRESLSPLHYPFELFDHYSIPAYDERCLPRTEEGRQIKSNKFLVYADCVLLSKLNPRIPRIWLPSVAESRKSLCSTEFLVLRPNQGWSREFVYGICTSEAFQSVFSGMVTGTSGSHQRVKPEYLESLPFQPPPPDLVDRFTDIAMPIHAQIAMNLRENATLGSLRDTLLPKLISGQIEVTQDSPATEAVL